VYEKPSEAQKMYRIRFRMSLPTNITVAKFKDALSTTATTADSIETELNPGQGDKF
jgi:hypothetical protein